MEGIVSEKRDFQKKAIKQLMEDRNPQGAIRLIREALFTKEEINQLIEEILQEAHDRKILNKRQFDIKTMRYLTFEEWLKEYFIQSKNRITS